MFLDDGFEQLKYEEKWIPGQGLEVVTLYESEGGEYRVSVSRGLETVHYIYDDEQDAESEYASAVDEMVGHQLCAVAKIEQNIGFILKSNDIAVESTASVVDDLPIIRIRHCGHDASTVHRVISDELKGSLRTTEKITELEGNEFWIGDIQVRFVNVESAPIETALILMRRIRQQGILCQMTLRDTETNDETMDIDIRDGAYGLDEISSLIMSSFSDSEWISCDNDTPIRTISIGSKNGVLRVVLFKDVSTHEKPIENSL